MPPKIYFSIFWVGFALLITAVCFTMQMEFLFVFALFCIYRAFFRDLLFSHRQYSLLAKNYGGEDWTRTVYFVHLCFVPFLMRFLKRKIAT